MRRLGAVPTEYDYYYYEPQRYVDAVARAGASRGADVLRLNSGLLGDIAKAFDTGDVHDAWHAYFTQMGIRRASYMRTDMDGRGHAARRARGQPGRGRRSRCHRPRRGRPGPGQRADRPGGYEGVALAVIAALAGRRPAW